SERIDREQMRVMPVRFLPRTIAPDHEARGITRKRSEVREHIAPAREQRIFDVETLRASDQRLQSPPQQRKIVVGVGNRRELWRMRGRQMPLPVRASLDIA